MRRRLAVNRVTHGGLAILEVHETRDGDGVLDG